MVRAYVIVLVVFVPFLLWAYCTGWVSGMFKMVYLEEMERLTTKKKVVLAFLIAIVPFSAPTGWLRLYAEENLKRDGNEDGP